MYLLLCAAPFHGPAARPDGRDRLPDTPGDSYRQPQRTRTPEDLILAELGATEDAPLYLRSRLELLTPISVVPSAPGASTSCSELTWQSASPTAVRLQNHRKTVLRPTGLAIRVHRRMVLCNRACGANRMGGRKILTSRSIGSTPNSKSSVQFFRLIRQFLAGIRRLKQEKQTLLETGPLP